MLLLEATVERAARSSELTRSGGTKNETKNLEN